jgi:hypothetical protein
MLFGQKYNQDQPVQDQSTWIDSLVADSPHGVMQVLSRSGYVGYLAPKNQAELTEAAYDFVDRRGEYAVAQLLQAHPLYDVIADISQQSHSLNFRNATGFLSQIKDNLTGDVRKTAGTVLAVIGALYLANCLWRFFNKE